MPTNRRDFLKKTVGAAAVVSELTSPRIFGAEAIKSNRLTYRMLGSTGYKTTEIGFGAMNTRNAELIRAALDAGINIVDTAHVYMKGENERIVGSAIKGLRDEVFLVTKIHWPHPELIPEMIETSLKRLQTDHVDLLLLHDCETTEMVLRDDLMKIFDNARKRGQTRFIGISTHKNQAEVLNAAVKSDLWEVVLLGYNYFSPPEVSESIKKAREAGLGIIGMKSILHVQAPDKLKDPEGIIKPEQALLKWVLENRYVDTIIPGMTTFEQLKDDLAVMGMRLSFDERRTLRRYGQNIEKHYCRGVAGCTGCQDTCPSGVDISQINRCLAYNYGYNNFNLALENYRSLPPECRLDACAGCDECVVKCIHGLNVAETIQHARTMFA